MNSKLGFILLMIAGLFLAGLFSRNGTIVLLSIPLLTYLGIGLLLAPEDVRLSASCRLSQYRYYGNQTVKMLVDIKNQGGSISRLQICPPFESNIMEGGDRNPRQFSILTGQKTQLEYEFRLPRGMYTWQTIQVEASDPFGLFTKTLRLPAEERFIVLPCQIALKRFKFHPHPNIRTAGFYLSGMAGSGIDFWGIREYHHGDSLRLIDWKKTSRFRGRFFSRDFEGENMADIGFLVDGRVATNRLFENDSIFEHSIDAAATLTKHFLFSGNRVSMLLLSDHLVRILPGYGKGQLIRILDQLTQFTLGERVTLETIRYLPVRLFPNRSVIVIISPFQPQDFSTIARLHYKGYQLLLVCPKPVKNNQMNDEKSILDQMAIRAAQLEHRLLLKRFQQIGIRVIDWEMDRPLNQVLEYARFARK